MKEITAEEMKRVKGGTFTIWTGLGIVAIIVFLAGVIDGYVHPKECGGEREWKKYPKKN